LFKFVILFEEKARCEKPAKLKKSNRTTILLSPPGAAPCILQHFVAICFFRNGMAELFAGSTEPKVEQSFPCNQAMLNITVTGTLYDCDELPCFVLAFKTLTKNKVRIQNGSLSNQNAHLSGWIHSLLYVRTKRASIWGNVQTVQFRHGHHIQIFC